jgi:hypothetical protein
VPDRVGHPGRDLGHQDVQLILLVYLEHLGHQPRAHRVGLATVAVDFHFHEPVSLSYPVVQTAVVGSRARSQAAGKLSQETNHHA